MISWQTGISTGLGTIVLGLSALTFAQEQESPEQEPPNKALLATEINEGRMNNAAQMRNYSWHTVGKNPGGAAERFSTFQ